MNGELYLYEDESLDEGTPLEEELGLEEETDMPMDMDIDDTDRDS